MSRVPRAPFTKTESPAYAAASASILFPGCWFAAERRDSLDRFAKASRPPYELQALIPKPPAFYAVKFAPCEPLTADL